MNDWIKNKKWAQTLIDKSVVLFGLFPVLPGPARSYLGVILLVAALFSFQKSPSKKQWFWMGLLGTPYLLFLLALFYSGSFTEAISHLETPAALALFPLALGLLFENRRDLFSLQNFVSLVRLYVISVGLYLLYLYSYTLFLSEDQLSPILGIVESSGIHLPLFKDHPIYISMELAIGVFLCIEYLRKVKTETKTRVFFGLLLGVQLLTIFLLARKGIIIALGLSLGVYALFWINSGKQRLFVVLGAFGCVTLIMLAVPGIKNRFKELFQAETYLTVDETNSTNNRINIYECSLDLIAERPVLGYGLYKDRIVLNDCYKTKYYWLYENNYNTHNQYLAFAMKVGLLGLILILCSIGYQMWKAGQLKATLWFSLLLFFALEMFTETIFERQNGVMLFAFFNTYLGYKALSESKKSS